MNEYQTIRRLKILGTFTLKKGNSVTVVPSSESMWPSGKGVGTQDQNVWGLIPTAGHV